MPKKKSDITTKAWLTSGLRRMWMKSKERYAAIKRDNATCVKCGRKRSVAKGREVKINVHHKSGKIDWDAIVEVLKRELFVPVEELEVECVECHKKEKENE